MARRRVRNGSQRQMVEAIQLFGRDADRDWFDARVVQLVMEGHTPRAAERIAAREHLTGRKGE